ncbi:MAG: hypothetical protein ABIF77_03030, partial [bacterium]
MRRITLVIMLAVGASGLSALVIADPALDRASEQISEQISEQMSGQMSGQTSDHSDSLAARPPDSLTAVDSLALCVPDGAVDESGYPTIPFGPGETLRFSL